MKSIVKKGLNCSDFFIPKSFPRRESLVVNSKLCMVQRRAGFGCYVCIVTGSAQAHIPKEKGETYEILLYLLDESLPTNFGGVTFWRANG